MDLSGLKQKHQESFVPFWRLLGESVSLHFPTSGSLSLVLAHKPTFQNQEGGAEGFLCCHVSWTIV